MELLLKDRTDLQVYNNLTTKEMNKSSDKRSSGQSTDQTSTGELEHCLHDVCDIMLWLHIF